MLPRYVSNIELNAWSEWLLADNDRVRAAWTALGEELGGGQVFPYYYVFDSLRTGLYAYFSEFRRIRGEGHILVSAQICGAVPRALEAAGFSVRFVDVDSSYPTPGARQFAAAVDDETVAVLIAPIHGHIQDDWAALLDVLGERSLVLDLAQGLGLTRRIESLFRRADAITYSFGLGKGLDTGGGLVLVRQAFDFPALRVRSKLAAMVPFGKAVALKAIAASGLYPLIAHGADDYDGGPREIAKEARRFPESMAVLWHVKMRTFTNEIQQARERAAALGSTVAVVENLRDPEIYFGRAASHLRQVIRLKDPMQRDSLIARLRKTGIDCAAAGEPLPGPNSLQDANAYFPNATRFRSDAVRLPFLGRMSAPAFQRFHTIFEHTFVQHLS